MESAKRLSRMSTNGFVKGNYITLVDMFHGHYVK